MPLQRGETVAISYSTATGTTGGSLSTYNPDGTVRKLLANEQLILTDLTVFVGSTGPLQIWGSSTLSTTPWLVFSSTASHWETSYEGLAFPVGTYPWVVGLSTNTVIVGGTGYIIQAGGRTSQPFWMAGASSASGSGIAS